MNLFQNIILKEQQSQLPGIVLFISGILHFKTIFQKNLLLILTDMR
jgi:hypothetical protein